jgi:Ser/Thr protein kinase RdoA (MazF antagonist)
MLQPVFNAFGISSATSNAVPFGSGLINHTWKLSHNGKAYLLQQINQQVFKTPRDISSNIAVTAKYLHQHYPNYLFVTPVRSKTHEDIFFDEVNGYFRLTPFVENSHTIDVVAKPQQAFEAAAQFGKFSRLLSGFDITQLKITLPDFHNLSLRFWQFEQALASGNAERIAQSQKIIAAIIANKSIVEIFEKIKTNPNFKLRATHHDTKISNVLFDDNDKGLCVIDLDTLMPGYFISDAGDMLRTYLSPVSEEEKDLSKIEIRDNFFMAIAEGYLGELQNELSTDEKNHFVYAGKFMIYMQAIRFITDHLKNDIYYGAKYEGHNFVRASNQLMLLQKLMEKEDSLQAVINNFSATKKAATIE